MNRENAINYLRSSGFSEEQISEIEQAFKADDYKQGWHDAITTALKETYTIHYYGDIFRVVQEETLVGVGMAYDQVSTEN